MEFIPIVENNHKEREMYVFYCQWTGNEEELEKLIRVIEKADCQLHGDYSDFQTSRTRISESAVDEHVKLTEFGSYTHMFQKCVGTFVCPDFSDMDPYDLGNALDERFYHGRLRNLFRV
jgi:hypothetical protein